MEFCTTMKKNKIALYYRVERYPGYIIKWKKKKQVTKQYAIMVEPKPPSPPPNIYMYVKENLGKYPQLLTVSNGYCWRVRL